MSKRDYLKHLGFATAQAMANTNQTPPMTLPQETRDRIWQDAKAYARLHRKSISGTYAQNYVAGATEWAGKAQPVIDALEEIGNGPFPINQKELEEWLLKTKRDARAAIAKYKEVSYG
jgi:hypothetical protein